MAYAGGDAFRFLNRRYSPKAISPPAAAPTPITTPAESAVTLPVDAASSRTPTVAPPAVPTPAPTPATVAAFASSLSDSVIAIYCSAWRGLASGQSRQRAVLAARADQSSAVTV